MSGRHEGNGGRTEQHLTGSENRIARGRNREDGTDAPDQSAWMGGGEKELLGNVANSIRVVVKKRTRLTDHGHDGARDHIPVRVDAQRYDWLNVEDFLGAIERPGV